jgi:hypothetical protein
MIASEQRAATVEAFRIAQCRVLSRSGVAAQPRFAEVPATGGNAPWFDPADDMGALVRRFLAGRSLSAARRLS